jgi:4a-hydroxytetrahydrobiopterin dehydratase
MSTPKDPTYADDEVAAKLAEHGLAGWNLEDGWLRKKFTTDGWPTTLMLVNAIGYAAEAAWHHPDLAVTWGKVWVKLKTHSAGGITDKDFALAKQIDAVALWRPPAGGPLEGTPNKFVKAG